MSTQRSYIRRRRVPRRTYNRNIGLLIEGKYQIAYAMQLGEGGMMLKTSTPMEVGKKMVLAFHLPNLSRIVARATVRNVHAASVAGEPSTYGVQFDNVSFNDKRLIRDFVASRAGLDGQTNKIIA